MYHFYDGQVIICRIWGTVRILFGGFCSQLGVIPIGVVSKVSLLIPVCRCGLLYDCKMS